MLTTTPSLNRRRTELRYDLFGLAIRAIERIDLLHGSDRTMSTSKDVVADLVERLEPLRVRARAMFGEYALYCDDKIVALVCDDVVFLKPTAAVDSLSVELEPCPPYPGAKDFLILDDRFLLDRAGLRRLVQATADVLPVPRPKKAKKATTRRKKA